MNNILIKTDLLRSKDNYSLFTTVEKKKTFEFILQSKENGKVLLLVLPDLFNKPLTNGKLIRSLDKRLLCRISEAWRFYALAGRLMTDDLNFEAATKRLVRLCSLAERTKERMEGARGWG